MRRKQKVRQLAQATFGYGNLRPGQETAIQSVLDGRDTLVVMPTGSGKSAIYQIAGQFIPGPTVVVSPMIALQRDQVQSIEQQDAGGAVLVNSTIGANEREDTLQRVKAGEVEFLFLAPEQFNREDALDSLRAAKPSLFVIDEAHCISEWGHDFRPDYIRLGGVIEALGHPTLLALTATASPLVRDEIIERLEMRNPHVVVQGFNRPNIWIGGGAVRRRKREETGFARTGRTGREARHYLYSHAQTRRKNRRRTAGTRSASGSLPRWYERPGTRTGARVFYDRRR